MARIAPDKRSVRRKFIQRLAQRRLLLELIQGVRDHEQALDFKRIALAVHAVQPRFVIWRGGFAYNRCFSLKDSRLPKRIADHRIDPAEVSANATVVVNALRSAGFDAYLVGGCVRDLLLGRKPKDFDVASNATPEQVREVFPRARLVGRRFRIVHVRMRRDIIEVSTFRRALNADESALPASRPARHNGHRIQPASQQCVVLRDNAFGTIDEDAFRRDFTINALYYDPVEELVLDYCNGMADVQSRTLRVIGDPERRFREDPVRMLRALRFSAKLDLTLDAAAESALAPIGEMLAAVPPARLFDELGKMFLHGHGARTFDLLCQHGLAEMILPTTSANDRLARLALESTDQRIVEDKPVTPGFLLAAFLWRDYSQRLALAGGDKASEEDRDQAASAALAAQRRTVALPRRHSYFVRDVWDLQPRLPKRTAKNVVALLEHRRFRAAYDFLMLRVACGEVDEELGRWWTEVQLLSADDREQLLGDLPKPAKRHSRRRKRRRRGRSAVSGGAPTETAPALLSAASFEAAP